MYSKKIVKLARRLYKDKAGLFGIHVCLPPSIWEHPDGPLSYAERAAIVTRLIPAYARPHVKMVGNEDIELKGMTNEGFGQTYWTLQGQQEEIVVIFPPYEEIWSQQEAWLFCLQEAKKRLGEKRSLFQFFSGADHAAP
jgi:hypothetical protein